MAVTTGSDPAPANWRGFTIKADSAGARWADYPTIGLDASGLYISANMFAVSSGSTLVNFVGVPKSSLTAGVPSITGFVKQQNIAPNTTGFSLQPAVDLGNTGLPAPILSAYNKPAGLLKRSDVPANFFTSPTLNTAGPIINVAARNNPPSARQPGPDDNIDTGDTRFDGNIVLQNGHLWAAHGVNVSGRAAIEWYEINEPTNAILQSGLISDPSTGVTTFSPITQTHLGSGTYFVDFGAGENRWGDYSATVLDPSDPNSFWTFQEFANGTDNWGIRITQILVPEPTSALLGVVGLVGFFGYAMRRRVSM